MAETVYHLSTDQIHINAGPDMLEAFLGGAAFRGGWHDRLQFPQLDFIRHDFADELSYNGKTSSPSYFMYCPCNLQIIDVRHYCGDLKVVEEASVMVLTAIWNILVFHQRNLITS
ncbi:unnamed protein product [Nezara viridula]|uniref:Uncharacterized protein n=1 Tax=Nezara viridula TaxID=85310 RepID=A0A9P0MI92_NEZVI|nr:unnamed protein product [Nezara viridula]